MNLDTGKRETLTKLIKFGMVGAAGVLVNNLALYLLYDLAQIPLLLASSLAVEVSIVHNFVVNNQWTFRQDRLTLEKFVKFNSVSLVGMLITVGVMFGLVTIVGLHYLVANLVGIALATLANFSLNLLWTWGVE